MGHRFENILLANKLSLKDDIKTLILQVKCNKDIIVDNWPFYTALVTPYSLKMSLGPKAYGDLMFKLFKLIAK